MNQAPTLQLAQKLIQRPSISPDDQGCQTLLTSILAQAGFQITPLPFADTQNFWATHGEGEPVLLFAGHTDVVPTGDESLWQYPPFSAHIEGDRLYGRGSADMKGSVASMTIAAQKFVTENPNHRGTLAFLITSDEEDSGEHGTKKVVQWLQEKGQKVNYCVLGEPSCQKKLGDVIKNGRRGSIIAYLRILGEQGHVAYPHLAENPIHRAQGFLQTLIAHRWDNGNAYFPPTSLQITNIHAGDGSTNVIPGVLDVQFNLRYSSELTAEEIQQTVEKFLQAHQLKYEIKWHLSGEPFFTPQGEFIEVLQKAVQKITGIQPKLDTGGGTSDGRFIAKMGTQVVEFGPISELIHKVNEWTSCFDLLQLEAVYQEIMTQLLVGKNDDERI